MSQALIRELLDINRAQSEFYASREQRDLRAGYRADHPTLIVAIKCMDGRVHMSLMTQTPFGMIRPKRNIGGKFNAGWPVERLRLKDLTEYALRKRRRTLFMVTYHYSKSDTHLGCAGHSYDTAAAKADAARQVQDLMFAYRGGMQENFAIMVGVETDCEALVFHAKDGSKTVSMADVEPDADFSAIAAGLYPGMESDIVRDLVPLMKGNSEHVRAVACKAKEHVELEHRERVIAVGQGFDWLHRINFALIMNDSDPKLDQAIATAGKIILGNKDGGRIPGDAVYFVSVPYYSRGEREQAVLHAKYLSQMGQKALLDAHGEKAGLFKPLTCVMYWDTRKLETID